MEAVYEIVHYFGIAYQIYNYASNKYFVAGKHFDRSNNDNKRTKATINTVTETATAPFYT